MNLQQMMMQAQKLKRELEKAEKELKAKEFTAEKGGAVTIKMLGNREIVSINIDKDALDPDNKEMIEELIKMGINELVQTIDEEEDRINSALTGQKGGLPF